MARRFKEARKINKLKVIEAAKILGVSQPTLSAWEGERKSPGLDNLEKMADFYGVSADFLLGRQEMKALSPTIPIPSQALPIFQGKPVWSVKYGWLLVNAIERILLTPAGQAVPFADVGDLYTLPQLFMEPSLPSGEPLIVSEIPQYETIWLEPVSPDPELRSELRGYYQVKKRYVQNEYGNRFYFDTYGAKWLAFSFCEE